MFLKEWIYTKRLWRSTVVGLFAPLLLIAFRIQVGGGLDALRESRDSVFLVLYLALVFTTVFRGMDRVRVDRLHGTGVVYLRTPATPTQLVVTKWAFELGLVSLTIGVVIAVLLSVRLPDLGVAALAHIFASALVFSAMTVILSTLSLGGSEYYVIAALLVLPPLALIPSVGEPNLAGWAMPLLTAFPPYTAFMGVRDIASGASPPSSALLVLVPEAIFLMALAGRAYHRMLLRSLVA